MSFKQATCPAALSSVRMAMGALGMGIGWEQDGVACMQQVCKSCRPCPNSAHCTIWVLEPLNHFQPPIEPFPRKGAHYPGLPFPG
eukprot:329898-Pelagomonas_calceolata.AAC.1